MSLALREEFGNALAEMVTFSNVEIELPDNEIPLMDYEVNIDEQRWIPWENKIANPELEPQKVVFPTIILKFKRQLCFFS